MSLGMLLLFASACDPPLRTAGGLALDAGGLLLDPADIDRPTPPVIVGSRFCPSILGLWLGDDFIPADGLAACFDLGVPGTATLAEDGCIRFDAVGVADVEFLPRDCVLFGGSDEFPADELAFTAIAPEDAVLRADQPLLRHDIAVGGGPTPLGPGLVPSLDRQFAVASDVAVLLPGTLLEARTSLRPTWNHELFTVVATAGKPLIASAPLALEGYPVAEVTMYEGDEVELQYIASGTEFISSPLSASTPEQARSLQLILFRDGDDRTGPPRSVHAIIDDQLGRRVLGAPVEWDLRGPGLTFGSEVAPSRDVLELQGACPTPRNPMFASVSAKYGDLKVELEFGWSCSVPEVPGPTYPEWTGGVDDVPPTDHIDDDDDGSFGLGGSGCACNSTNAGGGAPWLVLLGVILAGRRRRRR
ncbi:MAG: hypothetical protein KUG77_23305, partial [Nannocystaceae bacterium]|nr:hypothetical protein [Nannocystaceae bacterium]